MQQNKGVKKKHTPVCTRFSHSPGSFSPLMQVGLRKPDHSILSINKQHSSTRLLAISSRAQPDLHQLLCLYSSGSTRFGFTIWKHAPPTLA